MRYIVTGAAGHLGSTILRQLKDRPVEVVGLILPGERPAVKAENIRYVTGDVCRMQSLQALFAGADGQNTTVIHAAGLISIAEQVSPKVQEVNVNGTANMLAVSRQHAVRRFVYVSSVHAIPERARPQVIREVKHFSPDVVTGEYAKTKAAATQLVLDAAAQGFPALVVHPSGIIGPFDLGRNHLTQMMVEFLQGKLFACVSGGYDFVDVRDVAKGVLLAAEKGIPGECYILSGHYISIKNLLSMAGWFADRKGPLIIPMWLAKFARLVLRCSRFFVIVGRFIRAILCTP